MSTVSEIVKDSILTFPLINTNRSRVLYHVLCTNTKGYEWDENGEIVKVGYTPAHWSSDDDVRLPGEFRKNQQRITDFCSRVVMEVSSRMFQMEPFTNPSPPRHDSLMMNIPDNATVVWKVACEEMRIMTGIQK